MKTERTGHWIDYGKGNYACSECGYEFISDDTDDFRYCPYCGAKMIEEVNADDDIYS